MVDIVVEEVVDKPPHGNVIGVVKWFNKSLGFGFITVVDTDMIGKDIFAHHSCIRPLNSNFRTLRKGEYVHFDIVDGEKGLQASNITGILGGPLMCDSVVYTPQDYKGKGSGSPRSNDDAV
jgi:cold shock CspA family protein